MSRPKRGPQPSKPAPAARPAASDPVEEIRTLRAEAAQLRQQATELERRAGWTIATLVRSRVQTWASLAETLGVTRQALQKSVARATTGTPPSS